VDVWNANASYNFLMLCFLATTIAIDWTWIFNGLRYYNEPEHAKELNGLDIGKYVGGAIVVFNLATQQVKWVVDLDLSTDSVSYRAYIYSSPTVVDLDNDGKMEIIIGTSFGLLYVLHHNGIFLLLDCS
jgi:hypothetical protein